MNNLIIYGTCYGTTKEYAEKFSEMTGIKAVDYKTLKNLDNIDKIIYFGGLYAGGVKGLKNTVKLMKAKQQLIIVTVGLADTKDEENVSNIRKSIERQLDKELFSRTSIFSLRGGIDYSKLNIKHRAMMALLYKKAVNLPEEKKNEEVRTMIETYNTKVNFVDFNNLEAIKNKLSV